MTGVLGDFLRLKLEPEFSSFPLLQTGVCLTARACLTRALQHSWKRISGWAGDEWGRPRKTKRAVLRSLPHSYSVGRAHIQLETTELI